MPTIYFEGEQVCLRAFCDLLKMRLAYYLQMGMLNLPWPAQHDGAVAAEESSTMARVAGLFKPALGACSYPVLENNENGCGTGLTISLPVT